MNRQKHSNSKKKAIQEVKKWRVPSHADIPFTKEARWRIFKIMSEFISGFEFLAILKKEVSFFGSAIATPKDKNYKEAYALANKLGKAGYTIVTGGGPGVMEAANKGAYDAGAVSVGINIQLPKEQRQNKYVTHGMGFHYFFIRKTMLSMSSRAYIYFPGGYGTLDELFEIITLIQTKKAPPLPVVLVGQDYWKKFEHFIYETVYKKQQAIEKEDIKLFYIAKNVDDAYKYIVRYSKPRRFFHTKD